MKAATKLTQAEMGQAIEKQLSPLTYKVFTRRVDTPGDENDPVGQIFVLWKNEEGLFLMENFDVSILNSLSLDVTEDSVLEHLFKREQKERLYYDKEKLIERLMVKVRLAFYCESRTFSSYTRQCYALWVDHVESFLQLDIMDKAVGQAKIDEVLDSLRSLAWWFDDKDYRMAEALENPDYGEKMKEIKEKFDEMWEIFSTQDWSERLAYYRKAQKEDEEENFEE
jgi:hypothetical protein